MTAVETDALTTPNVMAPINAELLEQWLVSQSVGVRVKSRGWSLRRESGISMCIAHPYAAGFARWDGPQPGDGADSNTLQGCAVRSGGGRGKNAHDGLPGCPVRWTIRRRHGRLSTTVSEIWIGLLAASLLIALAAAAGGGR